MDGTENTIHGTFTDPPELLVALPLDALIDTLRATAAMGQALAARVESHRSAAAANRLTEQMVKRWMETAERERDDARRERDELADKLARLEAINRETHATREGLAKSGLQLRAELDAARAEAARLAQELSAALAEADEVASVKRQRDEAERERNEAIARLENDRAAVELTLELGKKNRDEAEAKLVQMERARDAARWDRDKAYEELASVKRERDDLQAVIEGEPSGRLLVKLEQARDDARRERDAAVAEAHKMKRERDEAQEIRAAALHDAFRLGIRLRAAKELGQVTDVDLDREVARLNGHQIIPADRPE